jgi:hypothetical protein
MKATAILATREVAATSEPRGTIAAMRETARDNRAELMSKTDARRRATPAEKALL